MDRIRVSFIERRFHQSVSLERVFRLLADSLDKRRFESSFRQLPYLNNLSGTLRNLISFRPDRTADIFHVTGHCHYISLKLPPDRTVLTIHDLGFLHTRAGLRRWALKKLLLDWPLARLRYVTVISDSTRREIEMEVPAARGRIRVIENPLDDSLRSSSKPPFNEREPRILQIGTSENKNISNVVKALNGFKCHLTIIGSPTTELRSILQDSKIHYSVKSELSDEQLRLEYENCDIVVFCSLYEGFGLPIIEGQAMSRPVLTSNISPMCDVAGAGGAMLVDPKDPTDIRRGFESIVNDRDLRDRLIEGGLVNVSRFERRKIAAGYARLYEEIMEGLDR